MFLLVDNYDSFTYNLAQAFQGLGEDPIVLRNDSKGLLDRADDPDLERVCLSPGPGHPSSAGLCLEFLARLERRVKPVPLLGVCLGHQILGEFAGSEVLRAQRVMHGKVSPIEHTGEGVFRELPQGMPAGRYHSLLVSEPKEGSERPFKVTARTQEGEIMGLSYLRQPWEGVQFHPESVLTPDGKALLANFVKGAQAAGAPGLGPAAGPPKPLSGIFELLGLGRDLASDLASQIFGRLMDGELSQAQAGALLLSLRTKGETATEVAAAARAVLARAGKVPGLRGPTLDVVGTGGDNRFSFNCSTATALICAALGHKVVKHGNRSVSSKSGSADVLEKLGFDIETPPDAVPSELARTGFVFLFAPLYHPAFRHIMPVRRELGVRTLFNILGPLVNPAGPTHRLIGVYQAGLLDLMAGALSELGGEVSAVVHGAGGYDELTPMGPAEARIVRPGGIESLTVDPADHGARPCSPDELAIADPVEGASVLRELLSGKGPRPMLDMLSLTVGMALYVLKGGMLADAMREGRGAVESGVGSRLLPAGH
ncbi:MAG: anthranilate phosphoribosyltransferase [Deltaproteobacteria bacterium]|jgi:anthranilate synthase/phosphoribosyltransferase|nr:anthranilate phosphoribosyltransferase [Deltaproteobacteria bacterium]